MSIVVTCNNTYLLTCMLLLHVFITFITFNSVRAFAINLSACMRLDAHTFALSVLPYVEEITTEYVKFVLLFHTGGRMCVTARTKR